MHLPIQLGRSITANKPCLTKPTKPTKPTKQLKTWKQGAKISIATTPVNKLLNKSIQVDSLARRLS